MRIEHPTLSLRANSELKERFKLTRQDAENTLKDASRDIWSCRVNHENYASVTNFLQGFFDNELNLNKDDSCRKSCSDYTKTKNLACKIGTMCSNANLDREKTICSGEIRDCIRAEVGNEIDFCFSNRQDRRYDNIRFHTDKVYGLRSMDSSSCSSTLKVRSLVSKAFLN